ncbi:MAG: ribonuclease PH [Gemmatimonadetes bacterium]|nr:ribonuclease PH [Gemmatimonadota bacterium]
MNGPRPRVQRGNHQLRPVTLECGAAPYAEASCLIAAGATRVLCAATVQEGVPEWRRGAGAGWVTAEYAMLPRATLQRTPRERGQIGGRTQEIQRLIGRALRASVDLAALGERTILLDCDVLGADGGTRTAAITGASVALYDACAGLLENGLVERQPVRELVAAVSVGVVGGEVRLDLDYLEDAAAGVDMNVVALESGGLVEVQGTAERGSFPRDQLDEMLDLALEGIRALLRLQRAALSQG